MRIVATANGRLNYKQLQNIYEKTLKNDFRTAILAQK